MNNKRYFKWASSSRQDSFAKILVFNDSNCNSKSIKALCFDGKYRNDIWYSFWECENSSVWKEITKQEAFVELL